MSKIIDITLPLTTNLPAWPNSPGFELLSVADFGSDGYCESMIKMGSHFGTHLDAPRHFIEDGLTVDQLCLEVLVGQVLVVDATGRRNITVDFLETLERPAGLERVLFKTDNSKMWAAGCGEFNEEFVALTYGAAEWLVQRSLKLIGIDYLSVQRFRDCSKTHKILLNNNIALLEGLDLTEAESGTYELICLPLPVVSAEGAPARAILRC